MYLIGPTSASTLRSSLAIGARSSLSSAMVVLSVSISFCAVVTSACNSLRSLAWLRRICKARSAPYASSLRSSLALT